MARRQNPAQTYSRYSHILPPSTFSRSLTGHACPCRPATDDSPAPPARRLAYWNGAVWGVGNGLTSTLVVYLADHLDAGGSGWGVGFILAMPNGLGVLRLAAPAMIARLGDRKRFCVGAFLAGAAALLGCPGGRAGLLPTPGEPLAAIVVLWCVYHLLQYLATVALWSWLADLVPRRIRGRFLGRRERWMSGVAGRRVRRRRVLVGVVGALPRRRWIGHAIPAGVRRVLIGGRRAAGEAAEHGVEPNRAAGATLRQRWRRFATGGSCGWWRSAAGSRSSTA